MQVTSLEQLKRVKQTDIVNLGKFEDGTEFIAELKKPNMLELIAEDKIPNVLVNEVVKMFNGNNELAVKATQENDAESFKQLAKLTGVLSEVCLVNPTHAQLKELGIELTQEMQASILLYTQGGVEMLKSFHDEQERLESNQSSTQV